MKMNKELLNKYKYVVSTGCSYGVVKQGLTQALHPRADYIESNKIHEIPFDNLYENLTDNVIILSVSLSSSGSRWQADSAIYTVNKLLSLGVEPQNIYTFIEWSEIQRTTMVSTKTGMHDLWKQFEIDWHKDEADVKFIDKDNKKIKFIQHGGGRTGNDEILDFLFENIKVGTTKGIHRVGVIEDEYYITPSQLPALNINKDNNWGTEIRGDNEVKDSVNDLLSLWSHHLHEFDKMKTIELCIHDYLNDIIRTQSFLNSKGVKHNSTFINCQFSKWVKHWDGSLFFERGSHDLLDWNTLELTDKVKHTTKDNDLEIVYESIKEKWNQLDLDTIYFHNSDRFRRGGIDEMLIDEFGKTCMTRPWSHQNMKWMHSGIEPIVYGQHPQEILYAFVWDKVSKCEFLKLNKIYLNKIKELFFEDLEDTEHESKNGVTVNKKLINEIWQYQIKKNMV